MKTEFPKLSHLNFHSYPLNSKRYSQPDFTFGFVTLENPEVKKSNYRGYRNINKIATLSTKHLLFKPL